MSDFNVQPARLAPQDIFPPIAGDGRQRRSIFFFNPATGTLDVRPDERAKACKAVMREVRRIKLRLYLQSLSIKIAKLTLQMRSFVLKVQYKTLRKL